MIAATRLRGGSANTSCGAASFAAQAIGTAPAAGCAADRGPGWNPATSPPGSRASRLAALASPPGDSEPCAIGPRLRVIPSLRCIRLEVSLLLFV